MKRFDSVELPLFLKFLPYFSHFALMIQVTQQPSVLLSRSLPSFRNPLNRKNINSLFFIVLFISFFFFEATSLKPISPVSPELQMERPLLKKLFSWVKRISISKTQAEAINGQTQTSRQAATQVANQANQPQIINGNIRDPYLEAKDRCDKLKDKLIDEFNKFNSACKSAFGVSLGVDLLEDKVQPSSKFQNSECYKKNEYCLEKEGEEEMDDSDALGAISRGLSSALGTNLDETLIKSTISVDTKTCPISGKNYREQQRDLEEKLRKYEDSVDKLQDKLNSESSKFNEEKDRLKEKMNKIIDDAQKQALKNEEKERNLSEEKQKLANKSAIELSNFHSQLLKAINAKAERIRNRQVVLASISRTMISASCEKQKKEAYKTLQGKSNSSGSRINQQAFLRQVYLSCMSAAKIERQNKIAEEEAKMTELDDSIRHLRDVQIPAAENTARTAQDKMDQSLKNLQTEKVQQHQSSIQQYQIAIQRYQDLELEHLKSENQLNERLTIAKKRTNTVSNDLYKMGPTPRNSERKGWEDTNDAFDQLILSQKTYNQCDEDLVKMKQNDTQVDK